MTSFEEMRSSLLEAGPDPEFLRISVTSAGGPLHCARGRRSCPEYSAELLTSGRRIMTVDQDMLLSAVTIPACASCDWGSARLIYFFKDYTPGSLLQSRSDLLTVLGSMEEGFDQYTWLHAAEQLEMVTSPHSEDALVPAARRLAAGISETALSLFLGSLRSVPVEEGADDGSHAEFALLDTIDEPSVLIGGSSLWNSARVLYGTAALLRLLSERWRVSEEVFLVPAPVHRFLSSHGYSPLSATVAPGVGRDVLETTSALWDPENPNHPSLQAALQAARTVLA